MTEPDRASTPLATYRLQFRKEFTFGDARDLVSYLADLGISHVYASPFLKARAGSSHGYDIIDHNTLNPEVGGTDEFLDYCSVLKDHGMGQIVDFVPNHMGIGLADNAWWLDVLEWGTESPYAEYFDIDWSPAKPELRGKVLVPSLGDHYGKILEAGELKLDLDLDGGTFSVWYYDHRFPVTPGQYARILALASAQLPRDHDGKEDAVVEFELLIAGFRDLKKQARSARHRSTRRAKSEKLKRQLSELARESSVISSAIGAALGKLNGEVGTPTSFEGLHRLLEAQTYRLAYWRVAAEEINYRRFFQINDLAGIRVEVPAVFDDVHRLVFKLIAEGHVDGLRIDHVDGLFDPRQYLQRLQRKIREIRKNAAVGGHSNDDGNDFYVVVEKILAPHERLREDWPIAGTTGYEFLNRLNGLFVDGNGEEALDRIYERFVGTSAVFEETVYQGKKQAMDSELASELRVLANEFNRLAETSWLTRDYTLVGLRQALREVVACFPVYRTYIDQRGATPDDRRDIDWAIAQARRRSLRVDKTVFDFIHGVLTTDLGAGRRPLYSKRETKRLGMKFQQYSSPVMAKGAEDTAFYRYNRLVSLNEVGGEPARFGTTVSAFHRQNQDAARRWPRGMLCTATHDAKRGEDARVRIDVLSEIPAEWGRRVRRWATLNRRRKTAVNGALAPAANDEYLFYQALVGAWPIEFHRTGELDPLAVDDFRERMVEFMLKAVREAKIHSSWINFDAEYEDALTAFVTRVLDTTWRNPFVLDFRAFHERVAELGMVNGLAQTTVKLTAPGVPDIYQGCELWDFSLVDPDNRRPVDFELRRRHLSHLQDSFGGNGNSQPAELLEHWQDGMVKMFVAWRILELRHRHRELFVDGTYVPLETTGTHADHLCSFVRQHENRLLLVCVPRLTAHLIGQPDVLPVGADVWGDTGVLLPSGCASDSWSNVLTGEIVEATPASEDRREAAAANLLRSFPVAVLQSLL
jgi:(1->4)-alpha-D-glucan 1-alpha-D-glucosylmutase